MVGPYKLREVIGEGGMGVVYVADQETPMHRRVALKIIKPGMDTREVIALRGRAAGTGPDEPSAHRSGAGSRPTAGGRPYFAMELVRGIPITEYCDQI